LSDGASANPQGALRAPLVATRAMRVPLVSNMLTKPRPAPGTSVTLALSCLAYVTKIAPLMFWMPKGA
jgi:hypothetical protein